MRQIPGTSRDGCDFCDWCADGLPTLEFPQDSDGLCFKGMQALNAEHCRLRIPLKCLESPVKRYAGSTPTHTQSGICRASGLLPEGRVSNPENYHTIQTVRRSQHGKV